MKNVPLLCFIVILGCGIDIGGTKPTHTMQEIFEDLDDGIEYEGQTITVKAAVKEIEQATANEETLDLETNVDTVHYTTSTGERAEKSVYTQFEVIAPRGEYKVGKTYTFTVLIETAYVRTSITSGNTSSFVSARLVSE